MLLSESIAHINSNSTITMRQSQEFQKQRFTVTKIYILVGFKILKNTQKMEMLI